MTPRLLLAASLSLAAPACALPACAWAADQIGYQIGSGNTNTQPVDPAHPLPVTGSFSASFSGFTPTAGATANLPVSTTSNDVALPAGTSVIVTNGGSADAAFRIQAGAGTAVTTDFVLKAGAALGLAVGSATHLSAITASGTTALNIQGGSGGATGYGGGSGGGGGGGAATIADGADATQGAKADAACGSDTGTCTAQALTKRLLQGITTLNGAVATSTAQATANTNLGAQADSAAGSDAATASLIALVKRANQNLTTLNTTAGGAIPAGAAVIGKVGIDQTTPGTTNGVTPTAAASGGSTPTFQSALSTTVQSIKSSAGSLYLVDCYNPNATVAYVQIFNVASGSVALGTTSSTLSVPIAAVSAGGFAQEIPIAFGTAVSWAATTTATGSSAPGTGLVCNAAFK